VTSVFHLAGRRILIAEDQLLLATMVEALVRDLGCEPVGPVPTAREACDLAQTDNLDGALLNVRLADGSIIPAARVLAAKGVPMIFITGNPEEVEGLFDAPCLQKPYDAGELKHAMLQAFLHDG